MDTDAIIFTHCISKAIDYLFQIIKGREIKLYNFSKIARLIKYFLWFEREYTYKYLGTCEKYFILDDSEIRNIVLCRHIF